jgi:pimeloyl-ACP methyl ester carboxylesterase
VILSSLLCMFVAIAGGGARQPVLDKAKLGIPFERYTTQDSLGRTITFYLSTAPENMETAKLPVVLFIAGSGCQSLFTKHDTLIAGGYQNVVLQEAKGRARVVAVEKPGVQFLDRAFRPGSAEKASEDFLKEHTLPRWAEANIASLRAVWTLAGIDRSRTAVLGHSEGGIVAARVVAELPAVTHVGILAGGGPTQLFDFISNAAKARAKDKAGDADRRVSAIFDEWTNIQKDPDSITRFWLGHPYRRWSSFLKTSVRDELVRAKANVYAAHGTADAVIPVAAHDVLVADLRSRGRMITSERVEGADHGFQTPETPKDSPVGMQALVGRVLEWFLADMRKTK